MTYKVKKATFKHIESELYGYHDTLKEIKLIREEILCDSQEREEENVVGGVNSVRKPGDPTGRVATTLMNHKRLSKLEEITAAIEKVYTGLPDDYQRLVKIKYWKRPQTLTWEGIARELNVGRMTAFRMRDHIVYAVCEVLGWR